MSHQANKDKPRSSKCCHFCLPVDSHNYCPACRESNKGDDPCVTLEKLCEICSGFSEEQLLKIRNRRRYVRKSKATDASKDDDLDLLGEEDVESFSGSHADLEGAAEQLFASPPCPQPLRFEALSLKTPAKTVPPTPGTALQQKIKSKLEKYLGSQFNIQLQQQMGAFQASMLEAMKSLRDEMQSIKSLQKKWSWIRTPLLLQSLVPALNLTVCPQTLLRTLFIPNARMKPWSWTCMVLLFRHSSKSIRAKKHSDEHKHKVRAK